MSSFAESAAPNPSGLYQREVHRLACLTDLEYYQQAYEASKKLGISRSDLNKLFREQKQSMPSTANDSGGLFPVVEPAKVPQSMDQN